MSWISPEKGFVSVISDDPTSKDDNAWFPAVPFEDLSDQV